MALIRCNNCGNMISDRAAKCPKCGIHITTAQTYDASPNSLTGNSPSKNNNNILYLVLAFLFVVILALLGYVIWANKDSKTKEVESTSAITSTSDPNDREVQTLDQTTGKETNEEQIETSNSQNDGDGYDNVLSERKLKEYDLDGKTKKELEIMRNSIFARHGYRFKRKDLLNYFSQFSWYYPSTSDMSVTSSSMSEIEKYNVNFIKEHE